MCGRQQRSACGFVFGPNFSFISFLHSKNIYSILTLGQTLHKMLRIQCIWDWPEDNDLLLVAAISLVFSETFFPLACQAGIWCVTCYVLPSRLCHAFCTITSSPSQQLCSWRYYYLPILQMKKLTQRGKSSVKGHHLIDGIADTRTQIWSFRGKMPSHRELLKVEWHVLITFISLSAWYCTWYIGHSMNNCWVLNEVLVISA